MPEQEAEARRLEGLWPEARFVYEGDLTGPKGEPTYVMLPMERAVVLAKAEQELDKQREDRIRYEELTEIEHDLMAARVQKAEQERDAWHKGAVELAERRRLAEARERELREWVETVRRAAKNDPSGYLSCGALIAGATNALQATQEDAPRAMCAGEPTHVFHPDAKEGDKCLCGESTW